MATHVAVLWLFDFIVSHQPWMVFESICMHNAFLHEVAQKDFWCGQALLMQWPRFAQAVIVPDCPKLLIYHQQGPMVAIANGH